VEKDKTAADKHIVIFIIAKPMKWWYGDSADDTDEASSSVFSLIFSALTLLVGSFDPQKPSPKWHIMCLVGR